MVDSPIFSSTTLFIGIDVGKCFHVAGFISAKLLEHARFEQCPVLRFEHTQTGIVTFLARVRQLASGPEACAVLLENTGHYHHALVERLADQGFRVYIVAIRRKRQAALDKTDKYDALRLANVLYAQLALGYQESEKQLQIRVYAPPTQAAAELRGLIQRRYEIVQQATRTRNKLTAICDELFPEFTQVFRDPNADGALALRFHFPTPAAVAAAQLAALRAVNTGIGQPSLRKLEHLQQLACTSIGVISHSRVAALELEQSQLIETLRLARKQLAVLEQKIEAIVRESREGQILLSLPMLGPITAGTILAMLGNIRNFGSRAEFRKFCGWAPRATQTGTSLDRSEMTPAGSRLLRQIFYLLAVAMISQPETTFCKLYQRLVPLKCAYDPRTGRYLGKLRVIGRICGQIAGVVYTLLKDDANLVDSFPPDCPDLPSPQLYDEAVHAGTKAKPVAAVLTNRSQQQRMV